MKAHLLFATRDAELEQPLPAHGEALKQDLGLDALLDAMSSGDAYLRDVAERTLLNGLAEPEAIRYRQDVLADCMQEPEVVRELYALAVEALDSKRKARAFLFRESPESQLRKAVAVLELLLDALRRLRAIADRSETSFRSTGVRTLIETVQRELDDDYLAEVEHHLGELSFRRGPLMSARLGRANRGTGYVLRRPREQGILERITPSGPRRYSFSLPPRDENGHQTLAMIRGHGLVHASSAAAQAADHVLGFFTVLRAELGFYLACLNLHERLTAKGVPTCFPDPRPRDDLVFEVEGLYDAGLALRMDCRVVGNDCDATGRALVVVTGANQGGKSTFLRSVGIAQLMMQAGMFAPAEELASSVAPHVFTHFKREEDASMAHGKLDEELSRMSELAEDFAPSALLLCNESFASTTEREGSEIARQLVGALREVGMRTFFVTHLYDLAHSLHEERRADTLFLRAERGRDGARPFRLREAEPLPTSFGGDSYRKVFGQAPSSRRAFSPVSDDEHRNV